MWPDGETASFSGDCLASAISYVEPCSRTARDVVGGKEEGRGK